MYRLLTDVHIPYIDTFFKENFIITRYENATELEQMISEQDILICRSTTSIEKKILVKNQLKIVATASSGTNHIDKKTLKNRGIAFFSGHGANAAAVCDYMTSTLAYLKIHVGISHQKVAIIGFGPVGQAVYKRLKHLKFELGVYDPLFNHIPDAITLDQLASFPIICLHPNLHQAQPFPSFQLFNQQRLSDLLEDVCIINAARGEIVSEEAILSPHFKGVYCTDVYWKEPDINPKIIDKALLCTPHIAGHSLDSKKRITALISQQIHQHLNLPLILDETISGEKEIPLVDNWHEKALRIYNPKDETDALKADPSAQNFQLLRSAHHFRHDFPWCC